MPLGPGSVAPQLLAAGNVKVTRVRVRISFGYRVRMRLRRRREALPPTRYRVPACGPRGLPTREADLRSLFCEDAFTRTGESLCSYDLLANIAPPERGRILPVLFPEQTTEMASAAETNHCRDPLDRQTRGLE